MKISIQLLVSVYIAILIHTLNLDVFAQNLPEVATKEPLRSIRVDKEWVLASNSSGIYASQVAEKRWRKISLPHSMPADGYFVQPQTATSTVYYYVYNYNRQKTDEFRYGLYRSEDKGENWKLASDRYLFSEVYQHTDGVLYAIVSQVEEIQPDKNERNSEEGNKTGAQFVHPNRILQSADSGTHWFDITNTISSGYYLSTIFPDPDHPDLICVRGNSIRGYVFQATDSHYQWKSTREGDWKKDHPSKERFKRTASWTKMCDGTTTSSYTFPATLEYYFDYPFHNTTLDIFFEYLSPNTTYIPAFYLKTSQNHYQFKVGETIQIPIELRFLCEEFGITIVDEPDDAGFWALKIITPSGQMETIPSWFSKEVHYSRNRDETIQNIRSNALLVDIALSAEESYSRKIDISRLIDFLEAGTYEIQLIYENFWLFRSEKDEWGGSFYSNFFTIELIP